MGNRRWRTVTIVVGGVLAAALLIVAAFPWRLAKGLVERRLSARFGRPVTIASFERVDGVGFSPTLAIRGLTIPQPGWAGSGDFVRLAEGRARLPLLPLLIGRFEPRVTVLRGLRLALVRRADGTTNWASPGRARGGGVGSLDGITISDGTLVYRDALRDRQAVVRLAIDPRTGVRLAGHGSVAGNPVTLALTGPAVAGKAPWPFVATIDGPALAMTARGTTDRPLDPGALSADVTARADDLRLVDAVIEAGLFGTQKVNLAAHVRREQPRWIVTDLHGTVGGSTIAGEVTSTTASDGRHQVAGRFVARELAFEDLASTSGLAQAAQQRAATGLKLVPDLKINLVNLAHTDGRIDFRVDRIVSRSGPTSLRAMRGSLTLDHQVLTVAPFTLDLIQGAITGTARVAQNGRPVPTLALDLRLAGSSIPALAGGGGSVTGTVTARAHLAGAGATIREAIGNSDGRIGFVARDGVLPAKLAAELGFNAGGALFASDDDQAGLRCVVVPLAVRHGRGTLDPAMIVDTSQSQLTGHGTIDFPSEAMAITVTGAPKHGAVLRLPGSATIGGTIREPAVTVAPGTKSFGNILKALGRAITGDQGPVATDADCTALAKAALG